MKFLYFTLLIFLCSGVSSQEVERQKTGWVYLLTNHIIWPNEPDEYILKVITDDRTLASAFKEMTVKRQINEKPIEAVFSNYVSVPNTLHVLYVSSKYKGSLKTIIEKIQGKPVLVITEGSTEKQYMMINLIEAPSGMTFEYNRLNITNQGLRIIPEFDELGGKEIDTSVLLKQAQNSVAKMKKSSELEKERIDSINILTAVAFKVGNELYEQVLEGQKKLDIQDKALDSLGKLLRYREVQLSTLSNVIAIQEDSLELGKKLLVKQNSLIKERDKVITGKENQLSGMQAVLNEQLVALVLLVAIALLFITALFLAYRAYQIRRDRAKILTQQKEELDELLEELKFAQDQLIYSEKLTVVGNLAEKIVNEVSNAINYVFSGIQLVKNKLDDTKPLMKNVFSLTNSEKNLEKKIEQIVVQKKDSEFEKFEAGMDTMIESITVGADRIANVLNELKPYSQYTGLGEFDAELLEKFENKDKK